MTAPLDRARWERLLSLFNDALERPAAERADWVAAKTAEQPDLAAEVMAMLDARDTRSALHLEDELTLRTQPVTLPAGTLVGPYRLIRLIGTGGMGEVYLADRADGLYQHQVAVKLLRAGLYGAGTVERFERERRILARLNHPAVVPLLDGGVLSDGRPYLVLQYVDGAPITVRADADRLPLRDRLRHFVSVCRAVEFAHGRLVIHRDLKPSNILLTADGSVRLLDFGIAKLLTSEEGIDQTEVTRHSAVPMTPERAAPEQLRGDVPTTATDVWALGVLLYELLTGRLPFAVTGQSAAAIVANADGREALRLTRAFGDGSTLEAVAAARATTPSRLRRALRGDLEVLVAKALQTDPERRYPNAGQMADDVEALLDRRPISARPDAWTYRARRFVSRHRAVTAAAVTSGAALAVLAINVSIQGAAVRQERDRVAAEAVKTRAVADLLVGLLGGSGPKEGASIDQVSVDDLLTRGETQVAALGAQPDVQARLWHTIATIRVDRSELARALPIYERAIVAGQGRAVTDPDGAALLLDYASLLFLLDRRADVQARLGPLVSALDAAARPDPELLGRALQILGEATGGDSGLAYAERSVTVLRAAGPAQHAALAGSLGAVGGLLLRHRRDPEGARRVFQEAFDLLERVKGPAHLDTLQALNNLAAALPPAEAVPVHRRLIAARQERLGDGFKGLAFSYNNLGVALIQLRQYGDGEAALRQAQERWLEQFGPAHEQTINNLRNIARAQEIQGHFDAANASWVELLARVKTAGLADTTLLQYLPQRAQVLRRLGRFDEAVRTLDQARRLLADHPNEVLSSDVALVFGVVAIDRRHAAEAVAHLRTAVGLRERAMAAAHPAVSEARVALGRALLAASDTAAGQALLSANLPVFERWPLAHPDDVAAARAALISR